MIRLDKDNGLWIATLDRPDKANALTEDMLQELAEIAEAATDARALVLTGKGKAFSAGMDLDAAKAGLATNPVWERLSGAISRLPCITIAALNGTVAGGAMGMVLACDLRIVVPGTKAFYPVMKLGFLPQPSDPGRLCALVGTARAKLILMAGEKIMTEEALSWGLFDRIVEPESLLECARALAADTIGADPSHASAIKSMCESINPN